MNKAELIDAISEGAKLSKADAGRALEAALESIHQALKKEERIALVGFGSFTVNTKKARMGRNPHTGEEIKIDSKKVVKFKAGNDLNASLNSGK